MASNIPYTKAGTEIARRSAPTPVAVLRPTTFGELSAFAAVAARSGMVPAAYQNKPDAVIIAVQMGSELGLSPMQSLSNIAVVNGRPSVWGDAMPGLCRQSALCDDIEEWFTGEGEALTAHCKATRVGKKPVIQEFGVADAKKAGLWGKSGPWTQYPRRMLQMRARGFALRDAFPDVLRGLISYEEAQDIPIERPQDTFSGTTINAERTPNGTTSGEDIPAPAPDRKRTLREVVRDRLVGCMTVEEVQAIMALPRVVQALAEAPEAVREEISEMLAAALARVAHADDGDVFPGDVA